MVGFKFHLLRGWWIFSKLFAGTYFRGISRMTKFWKISRELIFAEFRGFLAKPRKLKPAKISAANISARENFCH